MIINEELVKRAFRESLREFIEEDRTENQDGTVEVDNFDAVKNIMKFENPRRYALFYTNKEKR